MLDRQTAMKLLQGRVVETLQIHVDPLFQDQRAQSGDYHLLINAQIISCHQEGNFLAGELVHQACTPGPVLIAANGGSSSLDIPAGNLIVSAITGISETSDTSAVADVQLTFQPTSLYGQYKAVLDRLSRSPIKQRTAAQATFRLFDDGWRLQGIQ